MEKVWHFHTVTVFYRFLKIKNKPLLFFKFEKKNVKNRFIYRWLNLKKSTINKTFLPFVKFEKKTSTNRFYRLLNSKITLKTNFNYSLNLKNIPSTNIFEAFFKFEKFAVKNRSLELNNKTSKIIFSVP